MVYVINNMTIHDKDQYKKYLGEFMPIFERYGGKVLAAQNAPVPVEGAWPFHRTVLLSLPSRDAFDRWVDSAEYKAIAAHRIAGTVSNVVVLDAFAP